MGEPKVKESIFTKWVVIDSAVEKCNAEDTPEEKAECFKGAYFLQVNAAKEDFSPYAGAVGVKGTFVRGIGDLCSNVFLNDGPGVSDFFTNENDFRDQVEAMQACMNSINGLVDSFQKISPNWRTDIRDAASAERKNTEPPAVNLPASAAQIYIDKYRDHYVRALIKWAVENQHRFTDEQLKTIALAIHNIKASKEGAARLKAEYEDIADVDKEARRAEKVTVKGVVGVDNRSGSAFKSGVKKISADGDSILDVKVGLGFNSLDKNNPAVAEMVKPGGSSMSGFSFNGVSFGTRLFSKDFFTLKTEMAFELKSVSIIPKVEFAVTENVKLVAENTFKNSSYESMAMNYTPKVGVEFESKEGWLAEAGGHVGATIPNDGGNSIAFDANAKVRWFDGFTTGLEFTYGDPIGRAGYAIGAVADDYNTNVKLVNEYEFESPLLGRFKNVGLTAEWAYFDRSVVAGGDGGELEYSLNMFSTYASVALIFNDFLTTKFNVGYIGLFPKLDSAGDPINALYLGAEFGLGL